MRISFTRGRASWGQESCQYHPQPPQHSTCSMRTRQKTRPAVQGSSLLRRAVNVRARVTHWKRCGEEALVDREKEQVFTKQRLQAELIIRKTQRGTTPASEDLALGNAIRLIEHSATTTLASQGEDLINMPTSCYP